MNKEKLFYFSSCAVHENGQLDPFLLMELPWLQEHYSAVWVIAADCAFPADGTVIAKPKRVVTASMAASFCKAVFSGSLWQAMGQLLKSHHASVLSLLKLMAFAARGQRMAALAEKGMRQTKAEDCVFYSCWMSYDGYAAALCRQRHTNSYGVARGHAFDIDIERNPMNPYLMKRYMTRHLDCVCPISELAKTQLMEYAFDYLPPEKVTVIPFGSRGDPVPVRGEAPYFENGVFQIISCAQLLPIKQVELLAEALRDWNGVPIHWIHVGGGEGLDHLRMVMEQISDHNERLICEALGELTPEELDTLYQNRAFDVMINTSQKEGVPVTVMEAMRFSIPVIAPAVGGLPEIVNNDNGILFEPNQTASLRAAIQTMINRPQERVATMRIAAQAMWQEQYQNQTQLPKLFESMKVKG